MDFNDVISNFMSITSASLDDAERILLATDYNLENAVGLYFSSEVGGTYSAKRNSAPHQSSDAVASIGGTSYGMGEREEDYVRAPDRVTRQTLMGTARPSIVPLIRSSFASSHRDINAPFSGVARSNADPHDKKLAKIFKPPYKLMFKGTLDQAKQHCAIDKKWLMINIQDETDFSCLVLNRDVWSDDFLQAVIQCSFIFCQWSIDVPSGRQFLQLYEPGKAITFPYIAVIDPQTGAIVRTFSGPQSSEKLSEKISDFLERNPTSFTRAVYIRGVHGQSGASDVVSLLESPTSEPDLKSNNDAAETSAIFAGSKRKLGEEVVSCGSSDTAFSLENGLPTSIFKRYTDNDGEANAPVHGKDSFKASFKLPDNKRVANEFDSDTTIYDIFCYIINEKLPERALGSVDLYVGFPPKSVLSSLSDESTKDITADLANALLQSMLARDLMSGQLITVKFTSSEPARQSSSV